MMAGLVMVLLAAQATITQAAGEDSGQLLPSPTTVMSSGQTWRVWPQLPAPGDENHVIGNEKYEAGHYYNVSDPFIMPYEVKNATIAIIVAPGGGYSTLAWEKEGTAIAQWLNHLSISAYVLKYRVPARAWLDFGAAPLMDAQRAMGLVRQRVPNLTLGFLGFSAGGHLTAHLSTEFAKRTYSHIDSADDISCKPDFSVMIYPWSVVGDDLRTLTLSITSEHPVAFLAQAEDDPVHVENSIMYYLGLKDAKAPVSELHVFPRGGHGYGLCTDLPQYAVCTWPDRLADWIQRELRH